jgi:hypothetical protein
MRCCYVRFSSAIRDRKLVGPNRRFLNWSHGLPVGRQSFPELPDARYKCLTVARGTTECGAWEIPPDCVNRFHFLFCD